MKTTAKARAEALKRYYKNRDNPEYKARARATTEAWKAAHPERHKALKADWYQRNKERLSENGKRKWAAKTKDKPKRVPLTDEEKELHRIEAQQKFRREHREEIRARHREEWKDPEVRRKWYEARDRRFKENPEFLLRYRLRGRMRHALKGTLKAAKTMELIGCSSAELRQHIEKTWKPNMNWSNYGFGQGKWQIDHVRPLVSFSLSDPAQQREAFHFSNLSAEWWEVNSSKSGKWNGVNYGIQRRESNRQLPPCPPPSEVAQSTVCQNNST